MKQNLENIDYDNLQLASLKSRVKAFVIDDLSITFLVIFILWEKISTTNADLISTMMIMNEAFFQIVILKFVYQSFFIWYYGATVGKLIAKIKVIDFNSYGRISLMNSCVRSAGRIISEAVFYLGFFLAYYGESRQTFHDKFGKTLVIDV